MSWQSEGQRGPRGRRSHAGTPVLGGDHERPRHSEPVDRGTLAWQAKATARGTSHQVPRMARPQAIAFPLPKENIMGKSLRYFMWGYQEHYAWHVAYEAAELLADIGLGKVAT